MFSDLHAMSSRMTRGDLMKSTTRENGAFQWTAWVVGSASLLLLLSAGLELFVQRTLGQSSVAIVILNLFLALWSYVLGLGLLFFLSLWCLVRVRRVRLARAAMSRYPATESRNQGIEKPAMRDPQYPQRGMAPTVPSRSSRESDDGNETSSFTRVA